MGHQARIRRLRREARLVRDVDCKRPFVSVVSHEAPGLAPSQYGVLTGRLRVRAARAVAAMVAVENKQ